MWIQAPWKSFKLFIYWCVNEIYEHFTKISYCFRVPGWQDMKRKWRLLVMMFNVTPKKGVVDIDDIKSRGAEVSWRKKQHWTIFPVIQGESQGQQQRLWEVLTSVLDLSDGAATPARLRVKLWNGLVIELSIWNLWWSSKGPVALCCQSCKMV